MRVEYRPSGREREEGSKTRERRYKHNDGHEQTAEGAETRRPGTRDQGEGEGDDGAGERGLHAQKPSSAERRTSRLTFLRYPAGSSRTSFCICPKG